MNPSLMQNQRLRRVDRAQAGEQRRQRLHALVAFLVGAAPLLARFASRPRTGTPRARLGASTRRTRARCTFSSTPGSPRSIAMRFDQRDAVRGPHLAAIFCPTIRAIACLTRSRSEVNGGRRRADADAGDRDAVRRQQAIDERVGRLGDRHRAAEADVRLIDGDDDQAPAGGALVGAVAVGRRPAPPRSPR